MTLKSSKPASKKKYLQFGAIMTSKEGNSYIKLSKDVTVTVNGHDVTGGYLNLNSPAEKYDRMLKYGKITESEREQKVGAIPSYIKKEITVAIDE